jgi:polyhydroxyalkanoate synthesis repressor PhaR
MDLKNNNNINTTEIGEAALETQAQTTERAMNTSTTPKIIKRYQNRKLYDTQQSCYVTLDDIAKMIRANEEVTVIDNKTKRDITASTLSQIIFEAEKKAGEFAPLFVLRDIIQFGNGSMSSYLAKLQVFKPEQRETPVKEIVRDFLEKGPRSYDDVKSNLDQRVAKASQEQNESPKAGGQEQEPTLELPNSNRNFTN